MYQDQKLFDQGMSVSTCTLNPTIMNDLPVFYLALRSLKNNDNLCKYATADQNAAATENKLPRPPFHYTSSCSTSSSTI